ncbi:unnamed protein product [Ambrosiozyma monospora]|uniref:Unnamed protein product n=1 Tax=Ambrosiozyma monospora TaxID=43982 RepID=A0A9W6YUQ2_AMBMO|nr:unnamed protein product [Ambrosiozyma monospora]
MFMLAYVSVPPVNERYPLWVTEFLTMKSNSKEKRLQMLSKYGGLCKLEHWIDAVKRSDAKIVDDYYKKYEENSHRSEIGFENLTNSSKVIRLQ